MLNWNSKKTQSDNRVKKLFFLVAMPRSGNTLFTSIINQNPNIACTANSITLEIIKDLHFLKKTDVFQNYPDHQSLDNVLDSVYVNYYRDWPQKYIIDRGPVMTKGNFALMQKHFKKPFKCVVLLRDLMDVLASYIKWYTEEPTAFINKLNLKYDHLVQNPREEINKVYNFLDIPYYPHQFTNLQQININGMSYDDTIIGNNMHKIKTEIKKEYNPYIEKIPQSIKEKYEHIRF